ncbi:N(4)-(Beta-N-acetylglucosaminyl)-L-asparaginase [Halyomorpha halys]|uniref:N(4)-(Beta-N-acetylglucosaminyl)-L-asparaginase n=1 Tax=Halyomorpha halys TaxID=286706 RepID=UPI0006D51134|nr:N(4)-(Beta-N-acetylglucosaminyl)-L-asparaginase-like [Halyomorpha halys]
MNLESFLVTCFILFELSSFSCGLPFVITTWMFTNATQAAWDVMNIRSGTALDAVEEGCIVCEREQCDTTVGYGGSPDETGETTLDAMIFDGDSMDMGAVGDLRNIKSAISVARHVLEYTQHSLLVGGSASNFAKSMGFKEENLSTNVSIGMWTDWKNKKCQPNFWKNVKPDPLNNCGPYTPDRYSDKKQSMMLNNVGFRNHDTIGMIAIDINRKIVAGTSTNGAKYKIPGRVGDGPIPGSGAFADSTVGAAVETGDGDIMMRFSAASTIVEMMRHGITPKSATTKMIARIASYYHNFSGAIIAVNKNGEFHAACHGFPFFPFSFASNETAGVRVLKIKCH